MATRIKRWFALHEGGTKFYQVFLVESDSSAKAYVVTHWDSYRPGSADYLPIDSGESKFKVQECKRSEGEWEADRARSAKKKRGYTFEPFVEWNPWDTELRDQMVRNFGVKRGLTMHTTLTGSTGEVMSASTADELVEPAAPKSKPAPPPEPKRNDEWGSW